MRSATNPSNCLHGKSIFFANRRNLRHQKFSHQPACQAVSKRQAQQRWLSKDNNRDYFKGSAAVERVRAWCARNPGYWKRPKKSPQSALQDLSPTQPPFNKPVPQSDPQDLFVSALQDPSKVQQPLLVGLISQILGSPLKDDILAFVVRLVAKGQDLLDAPSRKLKTKIRPYDSQTTPPPRAAVAPSHATLVLAAREPPPSG